MTLDAKSKYTLLQFLLKSPSIMNYSKKAFTLIELLVVISIIALLIGILLPALGAARGVARVSASASNQRQIGIAMAAYRADNDSYFPLWQQSSGGTPVDGTPIWYWTTRLAVDGYIPALDVYFDPTFEGAEAPFQDAADGLDRSNMDDRRWNRIHYGYNFVHVGGNYHQTGGVRSAASVAAANPRAGGSDFVPARIEDMQDPTSVLVTTGVRDYIINGADPAYNDGSRPDPDRIYGAHVVLDISLFGSIGNAGAPHARYGDAMQNLWADGHVSTISMPFTQEEQDQAANNDAGFEISLAYGTEAFGDIRLLGGSTRAGPNAGANYFDIVKSSPDSN